MFWGYSYIYIKYYLVILCKSTIQSENDRLLSKGNATVKKSRTPHERHIFNRSKH